MAKKREREALKKECWAEYRAREGKRAEKLVWGNESQWEAILASSAARRSRISMATVSLSSRWFMQDSDDPERGRVQEGDLFAGDGQGGFGKDAGVIVRPLNQKTRLVRIVERRGGCCWF